jgi:hypothetical protein
MNNVIELATATISSLLDVQAQLLAQLERLQAAAPKCSECGDNRTDLDLYCARCLNNDGWYYLSGEEASRIESAQPAVPKSAAWLAGYNAGLAMAEAWRDDAPAAGKEQSMNREAFEKWLIGTQGLSGTWDAKRNCYAEHSCHLAYKAWQAAMQSAGQDAVAIVGDNQVPDWLPPYRRPPVGTKLYTHPQPAVPEVSELTGKQWAAMRAVIHEYAGKINVANHFEVRSAHLDAAPEAVYQALLSAGKEK